MTTVTLTMPADSATDMAEERADGSGFLTGQLVLRSNATAANRSSIGMLFPGVNIPQGSTIDAADIRVASEGGIGDILNAVIRANDVDNADDFVENADVISRTLTTAASAAWNATNVTSGPGRVTSPSIVTVIQEIVDRAGWVSGNDMCIVVIGAAQNSAICSMQKGAGTPLPQLVIEFTEPAVVPSSMGNNVQAAVQLLGIAPTF